LEYKHLIKSQALRAIDMAIQKANAPTSSGRATQMIDLFSSGRLNKFGCDNENEAVES